jgi:hypothetical protein
MGFRGRLAGRVGFAATNLRQLPKLMGQPVGFFSQNPPAL